MKTIKHFLILLLALLSCQFASAQEIEYSDAFYIYRNDGEFNGIFFDKVKEMRFSKLDIDSVEHETYVVQEIVTPDSIYRIPLSAIDSIGYQQPEARLNPKVIRTDERGLDPYIVYNDNMSITFSLDTPSDLLPKVGDVLLCVNNPTYGKVEGVYEQQNRRTFAGTVTDIWKLRDGYRIPCAPLTSLGDVFEQYVGVEEVTSDGQNHIRRRVAGPRKARGMSSYKLLDLAFTLKHDFEEGKGTITVGTDVEFQLGVSVEYKITWCDFFVKTTNHSHFGVQSSLTASGELSFNEDFNLVKALSIPFPASCPVLEINPFPKAFARGSISASMGITLPKISYDCDHTFIINNGDVSFNADHNLDYPKSALDIIKQCDLNLKFNGNLQIGLKSSLGITTCSWIEKILKAYIGLDLYVGPAITGEIDLSMNSLFTEGAYGLLNKSYISFNTIQLYTKAWASTESILGYSLEKTFAEKTKNYGEYKFWAVPHLSSGDVTFDMHTGEVSFKSVFDGASLLPCKYGYDIVAQGTYPDLSVDKYTVYLDESFGYGKTVKENTFTLSDIPLKRDIYLRPFVEIDGKKIKDTQSYIECSTGLTRYMCNFFDGTLTLDNYVINFPSSDVIVTELEDKTILLTADIGYTIDKSYDRTHTDVIQKGKISVTLIPYDKIIPFSYASGIIQQIEIEGQTYHKELTTVNNSFLWCGEGTEDRHGHDHVDSCYKSDYGDYYTRDTKFHIVIKKECDFTGSYNREDFTPEVFEYTQSRYVHDPYHWNSPQQVFPDNSWEAPAVCIKKLDLNFRRN